MSYPKLAYVWTKIHGLPKGLDAEFRTVPENKQNGLTLHYALKKAHSILTRFEEVTVNKSIYAERWHEVKYSSFKIVSTGIMILKCGSDTVENKLIEISQ